MARRFKISSDKTDIFNIQELSHQRTDAELQVIWGIKRDGLVPTLGCGQNKLTEGKYWLNKKNNRYGEDQLIVIPTLDQNKRNVTMVITKQHHGNYICLSYVKLWWQGLRRDIAEYCKTCPSCQIVKGRRGKHTHLSLFSCTEPFQIIAIDLVGPLPITSSENSYILTIIDRFSRMCRICPIQNIKTTTVARTLLDNWLYNYGFPQHILSDRGSQFMSHIFRHLCDVFGIKKIYTSAIIQKLMEGNDCIDILRKIQAVIS